MKKHWWKALGVLLLSYTIVGGFLYQFPDLPILNETIRNVFFHIPMWYSMIICFTVSGVYAIRYLLDSNLKFDIGSAQFAFVGMFMGCLGMVTGMEWAKVTWGEFWSNDPKQLGALAVLIVYAAYAILRMFIKNDEAVARISAVFNVFALAMLFPLIFIIPAHAKSLHPGTDGNNFQALYTQSKYLRKVSLPGMVGWILLSVWIANLRMRLGRLQLQMDLKEFTNLDINKKINDQKPEADTKKRY
jgi:heme exporter protein C